MKKVVITGSVKLQAEINNWTNFFKNNNYEVLDYPREIEEKKYMKKYPIRHKEFFESITKTDILFIMNEDKNGITGYIGAESFAELAFGLTQNLLYNKNIELVILKMPSPEVQCYDEIYLWLKLGWIKLYKEEKE